MAAKMPPRLLCTTICVPFFFLYLVDAAVIEARRNPALLTPPQMYGQLMKRDTSTPTNSCLPALDATSCDGLMGCAVYCCPVDQECCNALGCRPKDSVGCGSGYAADGWACCGSAWQYPKSQGATCCGGSQGWWCPAGFQCIKHLIVQYSCCTDDTCNVYWNGTDTVTVSADSTTPSNPTLPPATTISTLPDTTPPPSTTPTPVTPLPPPTTKSTSPIASATPTTCNPSGPQPTFLIQQTSSTTKENGTYAVLSKPGGGRDSISFYGTTANATKFTFNNACSLVGAASQNVANLHPPVNATGPSMALFFDSTANITAMAYTTPVCNVSGALLTCKVNTVAETWFSCGGSLAVGGTPGTGCVKIGLTPHFVKS